MIAGSEMSESQIDVCGKCGAEMDSTRRVDFIAKDGAVSDHDESDPVISA
jgi:hypothetical protein